MRDISEYVEEPWVRVDASKSTGFGLYFFLDKEWGTSRHPWYGAFYDRVRALQPPAPDHAWSYVAPSDYGPGDYFCLRPTLEPEAREDLVAFIQAAPEEVVAANAPLRRLRKLLSDGAELQLAFFRRPLEDQSVGS